MGLLSLDCKSFCGRFPVKQQQAGRRQKKQKKRSGHRKTLCPYISFADPKPYQQPRFKKLRMWPEAVECLICAERNVEAEDMVKARLQVWGPGALNGLNN